MSIVKCVNVECKNFNKEYFVNKLSLKFDEKTKKFNIPFGKNSCCDVCNKTIIEVEEESKTMPNIYLTDFKQLSTVDKKKALKKRADHHNKTKMKDRVHELKKRFEV